MTLNHDCTDQVAVVTGRVPEVADAVLWLTSSSSSYVTGVALPVGSLPADVAAPPLVTRCAKKRDA